VSEDTSSSLTPAVARTADAIASMEAASRPSEMFGTHSMMVRMSKFLTGQFIISGNVTTTMLPIPAPSGSGA